MTWLDDIAMAARPKIEMKPWMATVKMEIVTEDMLEGVIEECIASDYYGLDLETTGLDNRVFNGETRDKIVGVCLAPDDDTGYYIPLRHEEGNNIKWMTFIHAFKRLMDSPARPVLHNAKFDAEFLEFNGTVPLGDWDNPKRWEDTLILAYLRNTRERNKGLKGLSKRDLGLEMIELGELFPANHTGGKNFALLDCSWEPCVWYAASDAICTRRLYGKLHDEVLVSVNGKLPPQVGIYNLEKKCVVATRWMERCRLQIDEEKVRELIRIGQREWWDSLNEVYDATSESLDRDIRPGWVKLMGPEGKCAFDPNETEIFYMDLVKDARRTAERERIDPAVREKGRLITETLTKNVPMITDKDKMEAVKFPLVYDISAPEKLGLLLRELGAPGLKVTEKSGQIKTSKDELDRILETAGGRLTFASKLKRFREIGKVLSTYLYPMILDAAHDGTVRAYFNGLKTDTGRFSCSGSRNPKVDGGCRVPWQQIPNSYDPSRPESMKRIRECVVAKGNRVMAAIDYSGVELRIATNLSGEPKWMAEYFRCADCGHQFEKGDGKSTPPTPPPNCPSCSSDKIGDLHSLTAIMLFGEGIRADKKTFKAKRQIAKGTNFLLCYGGSGRAVERTVGTDPDESDRIVNVFKSQYMDLQKWWSGMHRMGKRYNAVRTAFGRHYPVPDINLPRIDPETGRKNGQFISKAHRNAVNGPVQGTSADITKLAMGLIYTEVKKRGWMDKVDLVLTIHDELVFEVDPSILKAFLDVVPDIMAANRFILALKWPVPLAVDVELGKGWNAPYSYTEMVNEGKIPEKLADMLGEEVCNQILGKTPKAAESEGHSEDEDRTNGTTTEVVCQVSPERLTLGFAVRLAEAVHASKTAKGVNVTLRASWDEKADKVLQKLSKRLPKVNPSRFEVWMNGKEK